MSPIAILRTPFPEKFGIPRQSGIVEAAHGRVEFLPEFDRADFVRGLESFSHIWLVTLFHQSPPWDGKATVRPPRLGGNERQGIFATRSPNRPNPIGLSLVRIVKIEHEPRLVLEVAGIDAVDGTPVLDIKPYLPWCESQPEARAEWAGEAPSLLPDDHLECPHEIRSQVSDASWNIITQLLRLQPQPAYHNDPDRVYGLAIDEWNVRWKCDVETIRITEITKRES